MKHTPGPWKVFQDDFYVVGVESDCAIIADHLYESNDPTVRDILPELEANARLIAAAPDLLKACQYVVDWHREHDSGEGELFGLNFVTTCISAIRKATL